MDSVAIGGANDVAVSEQQGVAGDIKGYGGEVPQGIDFDPEFSPLNDFRGMDISSATK
ncbi:uncharacterized protein G2W53_034984 [Senna tora]|uniref:Uncharacterized protein n=1 Tax=Senna tora TaxID=362788 RepID=A0A834SRK4_9FABA|nr:uncharacterized protein G2W53_034984 [Senna tora]